MNPLRKAAALWAGGCSLLFIAVYSGCNWITAQRPDVGVLRFDWERSIPFMPFMILPYWSLDLFFVLSFFLCRDRRELDVLGKRIVWAILAAGACFLLFPLRCDFPRPAVDGFLGTLFSLLRGFDQPHNLLPSLHITLLILVAGPFARRTKGLLRIFLLGWFGLVAASTVLTYQHHVIDLVGGFVLAVLCGYLIRPEQLSLPKTGNTRVAVWYAFGSIGLLGLMRATLPGGAAFAWPAAAMGVVAAGYFGVGAAVYGKQGHAPALSARVLLAPCLLGQYLSWRYYRRRSRPWDEIVPGVWIGRQLTDQEAGEAARAGVTAVLDLTAEFSGAAPFRTLAYRNLPLLDLTAPTVAQLHQAASFIREHAATGAVYVHCKAGYSRSAAAVGAYLLTAGLARSTEDAIAMLRRARPSLVVRAEARDALIAFEGEERRR
jgi:membrane-associated phospholipid phosphatase